MKIQVNDELKKKRLKSRVTQAQDIKNKKIKSDTRPCIGKLLKVKVESKQSTIKDVIGDDKPRIYTDSEVLFYYFCMFQLNDK